MTYAMLHGTPMWSFTDPLATALTGWPDVFCVYHLVDREHVCNELDSYHGRCYHLANQSGLGEL